MIKKNWLSLLIMVLLSFATIWDPSWYYYPFILAFMCIVLNRILGRVALRECGLHITGIGYILKKGTHRPLFIAPLVAVAIEILLGRLLFNDFSVYALTRIDEYLIFNSSTTLVLFTFALVAFEEIPWRCHFQFHTGRYLPSGWALLFPAVCMSAIAASPPMSTLSVYMLCGIFIRRILWGLLYEYSKSVWLVVLSHFLAVILYLILLVGL